MPAPLSSPTIRLVDDSDPVLGELADVPVAISEYLLEAFARLPDPRKARGKRHQIGSVLAIAAAAIIAGCRSVAAISEWAHDTGVEALSAFGVGDRIPSLSTVHRVLRGVDAHQFDMAVYAWIRLSFSRISGRTVIAFDGKSVRGAVSSDGSRPHLLSAMDHHSGAVVGQVDVNAKTNEIPLLPDVLAQFDITDAVVTVDALHTRVSTASMIVARGGHYLMCVKKNQPSLYSALKVVHWKQVPALESSATTARGRRVTRTVKACQVPGGFGVPHSKQVAQVRRTRTVNGIRSIEVVYLILRSGHDRCTSLADRILDPRTLGNRNKVH